MKIVKVLKRQKVTKSYSKFTNKDDDGIISLYLPNKSLKKIKLIIESSSTKEEDYDDEKETYEDEEEEELSKEEILSMSTKELDDLARKKGLKIKSDDFETRRAFAKKIIKKLGLNS